ncbi:MAG: ribosome maturation factor RimM [Actinomycetota bacterium]
MSKSTSNSSTTDEPDLLEVGHIRRPHGVRGDVYVQLITDVEARAEPGAVLIADGRTLTVERSRRAGNGRLIVSFGEVHGREDAAKLTNVALFASPIDDPSQLWVHELIGAQVVERDGTIRGRCVAVVDNPAADLLELENGALVPVSFVVEHDRTRITIDPPDGLFDL